MFQQRHFEAIAQMMQECHPGAHLSADNRAIVQWYATRHQMVLLFMRSNPRFDVGRFERACLPGADVRSRKAA